MTMTSRQSRKLRAFVIAFTGATVLITAGVLIAYALVRHGPWGMLATVVIIVGTLVGLVAAAIE